MNYHLDNTKVIKKLLSVLLKYYPLDNVIVLMKATGLDKKTSLTGFGKLYDGK